jgi:hypothetical protein
MPDFHVNLRRMIRLCAFMLAASALCLAGKRFSMPGAQSAASYPAHDDHPAEHVSIAVDPYDMDDKARIFSVRFSEIGFMPVFFVITNDGDHPVQLSDMKAQLITVSRAKLSPAVEDDIERRLAKPNARTRPSPLPIPSRNKVKGGVSMDTREEIQNSMFSARAVEPHSSQSGFLYFDVAGISTPLAGAHFYLTGVRDSNANELMYFEIPLEKYLSAPAK